MSSNEKSRTALFVILVIAFIIFYFGILYVASFEKTIANSNVEEQNIEERGETTPEKL